MMGDTQTYKQNNALNHHQSRAKLSAANNRTRQTAAEAL
jgi:hypothetical protein